MVDPSFSVAFPLSLDSGLKLFVLFLKGLQWKDFKKKCLIGLAWIISLLLHQTLSKGMQGGVIGRVGQESACESNDCDW